MKPELRRELFDRFKEIEMDIPFNELVRVTDDLHWTHVKWDGHCESILPYHQTIDDVVEPIKRMKIGEKK